MAELITISIAASVKSGPELKGSWQISIPSYEKVQLVIDPKKKKKLTLSSVQKIVVLIINIGPGDGVNYTMKAGTPAIELKQLPQVVMYRAGMLPSDEQLVLEFENTGAKEITIDALVGRTLND